MTNLSDIVPGMPIYAATGVNADITSMTNVDVGGDTPISNCKY